MSKKLQQTNRLNSLFANLEGQDGPAEAELVKFQAAVQPGLLSGWTWKADPQGNYVSCSPDLLACLGLPPNEFIGRPMRTYRLNPRSVPLLGHLLDSITLPSEAVVHLRHAKGHWVPVRMHILAGPVAGSPAGGWDGFAQILSCEELGDNLPIPEGLVEHAINQSGLIPPPDIPPVRPSFKNPRHEGPLKPVTAQPLHGIMVDAFGASQAAYPITHLGQDALMRHELSTAPAAPGQPAALAVSFQAADMGTMLLEVVDDLQDRTWTEDERQMVSEVASQLALALDNARLYRAVQQELAERERAEKIILQRNQDLSTLNQIGQRLSHLATRSEIFSVLAELVELVMDSRDYYVCLCEPPSNLLTFPLNVEGGLAVQVPERRLSKELPDTIINTRSPLLINAQTEQRLKERGILLPSRIPSALIAVPLTVGSKLSGALVVQQFSALVSPRFDEAHMELLSTAVSQAATALENASLFEQTQAALAETGLLYNVSSRIAQAQSADEMVQLVVDSVLPRGADKAAMMLAELSDQEDIAAIEIVGFLDTVGNSQLKGMRLRIDDMPILRSLSEDGLLIGDVDRVDAASRATLTACGVKSIAFVPMRSGGRLVGLLSASCRRLMQFNPAELRILRTVANGIAVALEKQRLLREAQRHALELQTASEIARDTTSTLSLDLLLNRIVNLLCERFGYYHTSIYFIDENRAFAVLRESSGEIGAELKRRGHKVLLSSRSIVGSVSQSGETVILNDVTSSPLFMSHPLLPETHAEMTLPLRIGSRIIGVLDIQSQRANSYAQEDANVLSILTDQIAIAIENARAYELAQKAIEDMREVDRVKSQFLANMSHELRTPLNSIIGFSRVILKGIDGPTTETQQQDLTAIYTSGQHLLLLINDILDLSKIEAGKMDLAFSDVNIAEVTASAMSTAVGLVKDKAIKLSTIMPPDLPVVRADSTRIRQVLINFLSNAAKFTETGTITVEAFTAQSPQGQPELMVTVKDSGPGIAERDRSKLFLPFSQVDDSPTRKTGGTGLGLSICRSLIEMHNGRIGLLSSEVGKGSTFFFSLPMAAPEIAQGSLMESSRPNTPLVLSIDDDIQVINLYQRYLQPQGYTVMPLTDPTLAVETARRSHPIAITLDVMMPNRDGWQVMQDLKDDPQTREIPIIVCSLVQQEEKGFSLGATAYLVKPFLQDELVNAIQRINQVKDPQQVLVIDDDEDD